MGVVPRVQSKLSRTLQAHREKKLMQDRRTLESTAMKRAMVRVGEAREKGAMAFVECLEVSQEDTMDNPLWRKTLSRSLGSYDAAKLVGRMCHDNSCRQETNRLHATSFTKTEWTSFTHNRVLYQALARYLCERKVQFVVGAMWSFRERVSEQNGRFNTLPMDVTTEAGALFDNHPRRKNKALLLDITIVHHCASSNLESAARRAGKYLVDTVKRKKNKYRGSFPVPCSLLPLAMSTCGEVGSDVHAFIKDFATRREGHRCEIHPNEPQHWRGQSSRSSAAVLFSFKVDTFIPHAPSSLQTRGGACGYPIAPFVRPGVCARAFTEGVTGSDGREEANEAGGRIGVGGGNGDGNGVGGGNGDVNGDGDGDGAGTRTGLEANERTQDGNGDR